MAVSKNTTTLPNKHQKELEKISQKLTSQLGDNLYSLMLYGSAVRGNFHPKTSDINILLILNTSNPDTHLVIAEIIRHAKVLIEPFVISRIGMERSFKAFAVKFDSIARNHSILAGEDPFITHKIDSEMTWFLCEQALRNLRLRSVQALIHWQNKPRRYLQFLENIVPQLMVDLSEALRIRDIELEHSFEARIPTIAKHYGFEPHMLATLLNTKNHHGLLKRIDVEYCHRSLFQLLDCAINWMTDNE